MKIRIVKSCAGPVGVFPAGRVLDVPGAISKANAMSFLNGGLAVIVKDTGAETAEYPLHVGGGWYETSAGNRIQGKDKALLAETGA